jgi:hypothetical protein
VVVTSFPGPETDGSGGEIGESLAAPELLVVDPMTALDPAVSVVSARAGPDRSRRRLTATRSCAPHRRSAPSIAGVDSRRPSALTSSLAETPVLTFTAISGICQNTILGFLCLCAHSEIG